MEKRLRKCTSPLNHSGVVTEEGISKRRGYPLLSVSAITPVQALPSAPAFAPTLTPVLSPAVLGGPGRFETPSAHCLYFTATGKKRNSTHFTAHEGRGGCRGVCGQKEVPQVMEEMACPHREKFG